MSKFSGSPLSTVCCRHHFDPISIPRCRLQGRLTHPTASVTVSRARLSRQNHLNRNPSLPAHLSFLKVKSKTLTKIFHFPKMEFKVNSPSVRYSAKTIEADYLYQTTDVSVEGNQIKVQSKPT